jgi:hypothetical protein
MREPYVELYKKIDGFKVYVVDGEFIRTEKDIDFTNFGQHYRHSYIPKDELWVDETNPQGEDEYKYYVQHMIVEHSLMADGMPYNKASDLANKVEAELRKRDIDNRPIKKKLMGKIGKTKIWLVEGEQVRDKLDVEFTEGGHDKVYRYIPKHEVWIDDSVLPKERPEIVLHEVYERNKMSKGENYEDAHAEASKVEKKARKNKGWRKLLPISLPGIKKTKGK